MPFHLESNSEEPNLKEYKEGYAACVYGKKITEIPFKDLESPEAKAWLKGYLESEADAKLKEIKKNEEIALLERMYNKKSE